jgi:LuxR family transcriptional regulator, maltose regulon positive regulatory protein
VAPQRPLLATKLYRPATRPGRVSRPELVERLSQGLLGPLTLVSAPAGFGKTTLASEWIPASPHFVGWVSLDEADNDPALFWRYVIAALRSLHADIGQAAEALLQAPQSPTPVLVATLVLNELDRLGTPFVLVLDDYHVITAPAVHEGLAYFVERLPADGHVLILTRSDPVLPLGRLRASGRLSEIRAADLRFSSDEARAGAPNAGAQFGAHGADRPEHPHGRLGGRLADGGHHPA